MVAGDFAEAAGPTDACRFSGTQCIRQLPRRGCLEADRNDAASCRSRSIAMDALGLAFYRSFVDRNLRYLELDMRFRNTLFVVAATSFLAGIGCSSSDPETPATGPVGGAVVGAAADHCAGRPEGVSDPAACTSEPSSAGDAGASGEGDGPSGAGGAADCNQTHDAEYGDTQFNSSGKDDDCKYQVSWAATPIRKGQKVTFTVTTSNLITGQPLERIPSQKVGATALSSIEPYIPCDPTHLPPSSDLDAPITETKPGVFEVGPLVFDKSGRWAVRFHFYEECFDSDTSPHGHAAFFVDVP